ncbi:hypothetical protein GJAV_G00061380 [Gymnothorax javanicus]|nr:hypothetical protein GJAV_G00061380 [Gymnothorax javanicus]
MLMMAHLGQELSSLTGYEQGGLWAAVAVSLVTVTTAEDIRPCVCRVVIYLQRDGGIMSGEGCLRSLIPPTDHGHRGAKGGGQRGGAGLGSAYVRLNVGGTLFYSSVQVLTRQDSMLRAMFSGRMEVFTDKEGWVLIDRCGKHFGAILAYLRDSTITLPKTRQGIRELLAEAKYYLIQGLVAACQNALQDSKERALCMIPVITSAKEEERLIQTCTKPVVKLLYNRSNNKYSYTSNSDDNLLKNMELFDKLSLSYNGRVQFIRDVIGDEICCWSFYGQGRKLAEVCCTSIVYATEKKQTKVEFPEARIYEETLNALLYETLPVPDNSLLEATRRRHCGSHSEEEEGGERDRERDSNRDPNRERVRRIHVKRYSTYDDRPLGH